MKRIELCGSEFQRLRVDRGGKKIDGIPDASGLQRPVGTRQHGHRHAPDQSPLHTPRYRVGVDGKPCAPLICGDREAFDKTAARAYANILWDDRHSYFVHARIEFTVPAAATRSSKHL